MLQVENIDIGKANTPDEQRCEDHFQETVSRADDARHFVRLPVREELLPMLGDSYTTALRRFQSMKKKFAVDDDLRDAYHAFINVYESLGHMEEVISSASRGPQFFHPTIPFTVQKAQQPGHAWCSMDPAEFSTGCRSIKYCIPVRRFNQYSTVINFRMPRYTVTADAEKMFRQTWVHPHDVQFQQILWRKDPSEPVRIFQLKTVTYGLASSPFHAARVPTGQRRRRELSTCGSRSTKGNVR
ncbi:uncharacterized protein LOC129717237 [Wyeomyia smithii]|uniref:uncharacterized protein LOC129717237 n=1 Tax=Wyeomyia smithii TaxID=174621 RepID=UPI002467EA66|nr:uncharacterized protein LOC129717237 [Wyeomyia smithii]